MAAPPFAEYDNEDLRRLCLQQQRTARGLAVFLEGTQARTPRGSPDTNVIDQGEPATYALAPQQVAGLVAHLEACRREGLPLHFSERQGTEAVPRTGIMLDFDMRLPPAAGEAPLTPRHTQRLATCLMSHLYAILDFPKGELRTHVFFTVKPQGGAPAAPCAPGAPAATGAPAPAPAAAPAAAPPAGPPVKYGFHVLVPGVRVTRGCKRLLLRRLAADPRVSATLAELGALPPAGTEAGLDGCLDRNSASVPVLFLGSCKRGGNRPYLLGDAYEFVADPAAVRGQLDTPLVERLAPDALQPYNLVYELALAAVPLAGLAAEVYGPGRAGLVARGEYDYLPELCGEVDNLEAGTDAPAEHDLEALALRDPAARQTQQLLDLLTPEYYNEYGRWRNVVFALAHTSPDYRPLAEWFSSKYERWRSGASKRLRAFDALWAEGGRQRHARPITRRSLMHWARECDPERFQAVMRRGHFALLTGFVYRSLAPLRHYTLALVLHSMAGERYVTDKLPGDDSHTWWEFVTPGQRMVPGQAWKWRCEGHAPDELHNFLGHELVAVLDEVREHAKQQAEGGDEEMARFFREVGKALAGTRRSLDDDGFKRALVRQAAVVFRRRGFYDELDTVPDLLGVGNGVLRLAGGGRPRGELVCRFHEWPVSRFTEVCYRPFRPEEPWTRKMLDALSDILHEPDARVWILMFFSTALFGGFKAPIMLMLVAGGCNGKTFLLRLLQCVLGPALAAKLNISLLTSERENANQPNSALMMLKGRRFGYFEESNHAETLNTARLKEIVNPGDISASEKFRAQETFAQVATLCAASNCDFVVPTTDHGTWRRIRYYKCKVKFTPRPDPRNPLEKKEDPEFVTRHVEDPDCRAAFLSILVHFWERLQNEYGGRIDRVPCPTITRESLAYRNSQDVLNRFISERVLVSPSSGLCYTLSDINTRFWEWHRRLGDARQHFSVAEVSGAIESSALSKFLSWTQNQSVRVLRGCRILAAGEALEMREDESLVAGDPRPAADAAGPAAQAVREDWWNWRLDGGAPADAPPPGDDAADAPDDAGWAADAPADVLLRRRRREERAARREAEAAEALEEILGGGDPLDELDGAVSLDGLLAGPAA